MVLKNMLVLMDTLPQAADRLALALELAIEHGASVTGLFAAAPHLLPAKRSQDREVSDELKQLFLSRTRELGVAGNWVNVEAKTHGGMVETINYYATFADLVVVGQTEYGSKERRVDDHLPERVVLGSGKPVLIVPYAGQFSSIGKRALVAWKTGRESARTLADVLPVLKKSETVRVFEVNPNEKDVVDMERLRGYLASHQISAEVETSAITALKVGDVLLNRVADEGSDLLVMGAYAELHFGTSALGEVARHVLRHMTVPVLMSH
ncbi:universal stress protein A [Geomonas limicola]|uniref:Universal stress protein A n=2 Tax=Geomonas limicola TaxID=2740186 RepID=A0A6V8N443_9BACT|nr:universal stress protein A [Geomonas limicola]